MIPFSFGSSTVSFGSLAAGGKSFKELLNEQKDKQEEKETPAAKKAKTDNELVEVKVETGEENESCVFQATAKLYHMEESGWKERGLGNLKLNICEENHTARISKYMYLLALNVRLFDTMKVEIVQGKFCTFIAFETPEKSTCFLIKFKDPETAGKLVKCVEDFKSVKSKAWKNEIVTACEPENDSNYDNDGSVQNNDEGSNSDNETNNSGTQNSIEENATDSDEDASENV
ncbi:PH domain-like protein [Rozella allomycis CSF55]|uniref:PH domain-like protein n=1 Tax=Rozella allomycis (strain CSF55) TaxID=988480 RepID=A0A075B147_ROZAC|nr:Ran-binding domain-containing protein [Rozella allomycis CSF55]RKP17854.1 PH domain-like protein [Rozella allomycis CSF55]|eukprot:EPZ36078.1 Ran-binding domain-containing protein [Rozella allomycis CSF55]